MEPIELPELMFTPSCERPGFDPNLESFASLGCLQYTNCEPAWPERLLRAGHLVDRDPGLGGGSVEAMAVAGNSAGLLEAIGAKPELLNVRCGPLEWAPLLYAVYSRVSTKVPEWSIIETVSVLLGAGADPNVGFLWRGLVPPFTALTGALGGGERGESRHSDGLAIARLLLEAGADPNDGQAVYNNGIGSWNSVDALSLQLLIDSGLGEDHGGPWYSRFGSKLHPPAYLLTEAKRAVLE